MPTDLLDKREVRIRQMFSEVAPRYDFLNHLLSLNIDKRWRNFVVKQLPAVGTTPILDLCTGTGDLALTYHKATNGTVPIVGADFCHEMLVRAEAKAMRSFPPSPLKGEGRGGGDGDRGQLRVTSGSATPLPNPPPQGGREQDFCAVQFLEADAQHLPFADNHFQIVTNSFGLRNITDTDQGIREMVRVLQPGGRLGILEFSKPRNKILGSIYLGYFRSVLPRIGQVISRNNQAAYKYLPESVLQFPDGEAMVAKLTSHGLRNVRFHPLTFGIATLYVGEK